MLFFLSISLLYAKYVCSASATQAGLTQRLQRLEAHDQERSAAFARAVQTWDTALQLQAEQLANTAHDLNNWSQQIVSANEMLRQFVESSGSTEIGRGYEAVAEAIDCCCIIEHALQEQSDLLAILLAAARCDAGLPPSVRSAPTHLARLVQQIARQCQPYLHAHGATLQIVAPSDLPLVSCDPRYVKRVLALSIRNRVRTSKVAPCDGGEVVQITLAHDAAGVRCHIGGSSKDADSDHVTIAVPASQADQTHAPCSERDISADLALCSRLITLHPGGHFTSQSPAHTGICVLIQLPLDPASQKRLTSLSAL